MNYATIPTIKFQSIFITPKENLYLIEMTPYFPRYLQLLATIISVLGGFWICVLCIFYIIEIVYYVAFSVRLVSLNIKFSKVLMWQHYVSSYLLLFRESNTPCMKILCCIYPFISCCTLACLLSLAIYE